MKRNNFVEEKRLKKCETYDDVQRSTVYCNYCGEYIYNGHTEDCQAYDTSFDFMKQVRAKQTQDKNL